MIRPYLLADQEAVLAILTANTPKYFATGEVLDFQTYLEQELEDYFVVMDRHHKIIGSGGINYFRNEAQARISWDLVHPSYQGKGVGAQLTQFRIQYIRQHNASQDIQQNPSIQTILVRTSQLAYKFYEKMGFSLIEIKKDYWAPGFDLYEMQYIV